MKIPTLFFFVSFFCAYSSVYAVPSNDCILLESVSNSPSYELKVELAEFVAEKTKDKGIAINWVTASNQNSPYFYVEHSTSGRNFFTIGKIEVTEKNAKHTGYSFLHDKPSPNKNYYRLRQVNPDGTFSFSEIKMVDLNE